MPEIPATSLKRVRFQRSRLRKERFYSEMRSSRADCGIQSQQVRTNQIKDYPEADDLCGTPKLLCLAHLDPDFGRTLCAYMTA